MTEDNSVNPVGNPPQSPLALAIILCDNVHVDPSTGKKTILGTYSAFRSPVYPFKVPQIVIYMALADGRGVTPFELRLVKVDNQKDEEDTVFSMEGELTFGDPLAIMELVMGAGGFEVPSPGEYRFQLYAPKTEFVIERRLVFVDNTIKDQQ